VSIRVLLADDQALVRGGLRKIVDGEDDMAVVAEAADGIQAVDAARRHTPDVAVVDIRMPHLDGIEATRRIVDALGESVRVLMLTTFGLDEYVFAALRAGASGFMLKDVRPAELVEAIRVVARGDALLAPQVTRLRRRDRRRALPQRRHGEDARDADAAEARHPRSRAGGGRRLRVRPRHAGRDRPRSLTAQAGCGSGWGTIRIYGFGASQPSG
jgi:DNA-binding NarL/FixJ family response regulator